MAARKKNMVKMLITLKAITPEVEASAVISPDGFNIASLLPAKVEEDRMAAMSAAMLILGERKS